MGVSEDMVGKHKKHETGEGEGEDRNGKPGPEADGHAKETSIPPISGSDPKAHSELVVEMKPEQTPATPVQAPAEESVDSLKNRLLRLQADFENFRKRTVREKGEMFQRAREDLLLELLPVLDHLDLALQSTEKAGAPSSFVEGVRLVREQMFSVFGKFGLSLMETEGGDFDPHRHEAISHLASDAVGENKILTQTRPGYMLGDRLLRPAQVVVSSGKAGDPVAGEMEECEE